MNIAFFIKPRDWRQRHRLLSGQILAEACIGLSLMVLLWTLLAYSTYMANNRIRSVIAVRDAVWLQANGESISSVPGAFYSGNDVNLAATPSGQQIGLDLGPVPLPTALWGGGAWVNSVNFGMQASELPGTKQYPFVLLNMHVPFMPTSLLDGFLSVTSNCAWPADTANTWTSLVAAVGGGNFSIPSF